MPAPWWKWVTVGWRDGWRYPDAWHRLWPFRPAMCWMGRHDYFVEHLEGDGAMLMCFDCEHRKHQISVKKER